MVDSVTMEKTALQLAVSTTHAPSIITVLLSKSLKTTCLQVYAMSITTAHLDAACLASVKTTPNVLNDMIFL